MNLKDVIEHINYRICDYESFYIVQDQNLVSDREIFIYLRPAIRLFDRVVVADDVEVEIEELSVQLNYKVKIVFDSIDILNGTCSYKYDLEFQEAYVFNMSDHEELRGYIHDKIESDIANGRNLMSEDESFEIVIKKLQ